MKSICVYCASNFGKNEAFARAANEVGQLLAQREITLVYGGGSVGLMGVVADAVIDNGGKAIGVLPRFMDQKELGHDGLTEMVLVDSMHQRKLKMAELAEGFIALPGGLGTLEELAEILTWVQLQLVNKPVGLLNVDGYYHHLIKMLETMVENALLRKENKDNLLISDDASGLLDEMKRHKPQFIEKWIDRV